MPELTSWLLPWDDDRPCKYVVVFSRFQGRLLLSRHRDRSTWETQGGHVEPGESPWEAARRELWEESGAEEFTLEPLFHYHARLAADPQDPGAAGAVFFAEIARLGPLPESEMAQVKAFDSLPENITYPGITPRLYQRIQGRFTHQEDGMDLHILINPNAGRQIIMQDLEAVYGAFQSAGTGPGWS